MASPRYLTKSRFKLAVECPTKLFYTGKDDEYANSMAGDEFLASLARGGYQVGALAKLRYPDGVEIYEKEHAAAEERTRELLVRDSVVLFEPAIRVGGLFIRIDVLVKSGNKFELIEVKAKSYNSAKPEIAGKGDKVKADMVPYIQDAAFQTLVLSKAYPGAEISTFLMMPDKAMVASVGGVNQAFKVRDDSSVELRLPANVNMEAIAQTLLAKVNVDPYVKQVLDAPLDTPGGSIRIDDAISTWSQAYSEDRKLSSKVGAQCSACEFFAEPGSGLKSGFHECWKTTTGLTDADLASGTVLDLHNCRRKQKLFDAGVFKLSQVKKEDLGEFSSTPSPDGLSALQRQWFQVSGLPEKFQAKGYYFDADLVRKEMQRWKFPYHFIDFETAAVALPFHAGMRPYEQIAFQFSHHILDDPGARVRHAGQFLLATPGTFPNFSFAHALRDELGGDDGTVFMWSSHENTILSKIQSQLSTHRGAPADSASLSDFLGTLTTGGARAMVDLCAIASKAFFHPETKGSSSIKKVLPAILNVSPRLWATYGKPIYGAPGGIESLNFASEIGIAWIDLDPSRKVSDPYTRLELAAKDLLPAGQSFGEAAVVAEGGAAIAAYARLQFGDLDAKARQRTESALLRYCELDSLAMVMVMQAWLADCGL